MEKCPNVLTICLTPAQGHTNVHITELKYACMYNIFDDVTVLSEFFNHKFGLLSKEWYQVPLFRRMKDDFVRQTMASHLHVGTYVYAATIRNITT
jgi:hypothetical protein